jgi:quercetin dioxygenase-like cupin family protein
MQPRIIRANERPTKLGPADSFVGTVLQDPIMAREAPSRLQASKVTFTPGARTNWHTHAVGQILHVLSGVGRYQIEGESLHEIRPGDTVVIPPGVKHWHGSSPGQMMCHLAMSESDDEGRGTEWLEPVSDADYRAAPVAE